MTQADVNVQTIRFYEREGLLRQNPVALGWIPEL